MHLLKKANYLADHIKSEHAVRTMCMRERERSIVYIFPGSSKLEFGRVEFSDVDTHYYVGVDRVAKDQFYKSLKELVGG